MSLLGFLTGVGSLFAGSQGDETKSSGNKTTNQSSSGVQASTTTGTGVSKTNNQSEVYTGSTTTAKESGKTTASTVQSGTSSSTGVQTGAQSQTTNMYSSDILASLDTILKGQLNSGSAQTATDAVAGRLSQVQDEAAGGGFDVEGYVSGIAAAAGAATQSDLDSRINQTLSATGSSETGNSMSALLGNRMRNEASANLAGIVANATATGKQIRTQEQASLTDQISELSGGLSAQLNQLLGVTAGASQTTTGTNVTQTAQQQQDAATQASVGTSDTTSSAQQTGTQVSRERGYESTSQNQTSLTKTQQKANENTNASQDSSSGGDIFGNLFKKLADSAAAA